MGRALSYPRLLTFSVSVSPCTLAAPGMAPASYAQSEQIADGRFVVASENIVRCSQQVVGGISIFFGPYCCM